jgi:hypothetical protein|tara:strand:- start:372 stop:599 length:228 start_codon:yes stop_codon:yes gene_type:complete
MSLFCKQCKGRRLPKTTKPENKTLWLCENCKNFTDSDDLITREARPDECDVSQKNYKKWIKSIPPTDGTKDSFRY